MKTQTRVLAVTALAVAGALAALYLGSFVPAMRLSVVAIASIFVVICVIEGGLRYGALCFAATALLGFFLVPDRFAVLFYATFLGAYPLVKSLLERQAKRLEWPLKCAVFSAAFAVYMVFLQEILFGAVLAEGWLFPLAILVGNVVFIVYDIGLSKLIGFYLARVYKYRES